MKRSLKEFNKILIRNLFWLFTLVLLSICCARKDDVSKGIDAIKKGEYAKAIRSLNEALRKDTLNAEIHFNLCFAYAPLDSVEESFYHYQKLHALGSNLIEDRQLRETLAALLNLEPYPSSIIPMKRVNQFKAAFHPDGEIIAVAAAKIDRADIYLMKLDGTVIKKIISRGTDPAFSPSGEHIVYVSDRDGDEDLYLFNVKNNEYQRLTDNTAQDFAPAFSPDGKEVVYVSNRDDPYKWEIYAVNVENGRIRRLTNNDYWDGFPRFTANGQSIVFSSKRNGSEDIYVMRRDGGAQELLFSSPADDNNPILVQENLFFKSLMDGEWEVHQYNVRTKRLVRLTNNSWPDWNPQISGDGMKMLVSRKIRGRWVLYFINLADPLDADFIVAEIKKRKG